VVGVNPAIEMPGRPTHGRGGAGVATPVGRVGTVSGTAGKATDGDELDVVVVVVDADPVPVPDLLEPVDPKGAGAVPA
jgi:hypothetical protein